MDPIKFKLLTEPLLRYSPRLERDILIKSTKPLACDYCPKQVVDQLITCEAHKLGTKDQHFKHKCYSCRMTVYDGSYRLTARTLRPFNNYTPTIKILSGSPPRPNITKNGLAMGRPRKPKVERVKLPRGRPKKRPVL